MFKKLFLIAAMAGFAFAAGGSGETNYDIVPRVVNFLIFAVILYYLIAEPIKTAVKGRSEGIANELQKVQDKLQESKVEREKAESKITEAKKLAEEIILTSKKENTLLSEKIASQCASDLEIIEKQNNDLMELERRKMVREVVEEIMEELLSEENFAMDKEAFTQVILKKVA